MKINWNEKYTTISVYTVITFAACMLLVFFVTKISVVSEVLEKFIKTLSPIIWGFVIAYLLNPFMKLVERNLKKILEKKQPRPKLCRGLATAAAIVFGLAVITSLLLIIVPQLMRNILEILSNAQNYLNNIYSWIGGKLDAYPELLDTINSQFDQIRTAIINAVNNLVPKIGELTIRLKDSAFSVIGGIGHFVIGFIVAVYFLIDKEHFEAQVKKLLAAVLPEKADASVRHICSRVNTQVVNFLSGKIIDSLIIGMICFVAMKFISPEYATLISVLVGITNIIPFFGPFIGAIPSGVLLLVSDPEHVIAFVIMIVLLQQLDGNIIGPAIIGDSTGLSPFWVMFAIFVGGGMFGFVGMILGVPIFAVLYEIVSEFVSYRLSEKNLSTATADYYSVHEDRPMRREGRRFKIPASILEKFRKNDTGKTEKDKKAKREKK